MGNRALIQLTTKGHQCNPEYSPVLYLHYAGSHAPELIIGLAGQMGGRLNDMAYSFARLTGRAHNMTGGDAEALSLGVWSIDGLLTAEMSHGDAGVFVFNLDTKKVYYGGGYKPELPADTNGLEFVKMEKSKAAERNPA